MKILIYIPDLNQKSGGTTAYIKFLATVLKSKCHIDIVTCHKENEIKPNDNIIHFIRHNLFGFLDIKKIILNIGPDVLHVNTCWLPIASFITSLAYKRNISIIYSTHGMLEPWIMKRHAYTRKKPAMLLYQRRALNMADCIIATSESEKGHIKELGIKSDIRVIPLGIEINKYTFKKSWVKKKTILFLSRLHVKKGIEILLHAAYGIKDILTDYNIIIAGEGDKKYTLKLKKLVNELKLNDIISFAGGVYGKEKIRLLQQADILVLPTYSENFGIVVIEALACGTPVITTTGTPWKELYDRNCGWWVKPTVEDITKALTEYTKKTDDELMTMGKNGRKLVEEKYTAEIMANRTLALYKEITANKRNKL